MEGYIEDGPIDRRGCRLFSMPASPYICPSRVYQLDAYSSSAQPYRSSAGHNVRRRFISAISHRPHGAYNERSVRTTIKDPSTSRMLRTLDFQVSNVFLCCNRSRPCHRSSIDLLLTDHSPCLRKHSILTVAGAWASNPWYLCVQHGIPLTGLFRLYLGSHHATPRPQKLRYPYSIFHHYTSMHEVLGDSLRKSFM